MRHALLITASILNCVASATADEPLADALIYATDDPRVFELRLPEAFAVAEEPPEPPPEEPVPEETEPIRLTTYVCPHSGACDSGCSVCNRPVYERWSTSIDYLLFDVGNAYSSSFNGNGTTASGVRFQIEQEVEQGLGWRVRYEWFGDEGDPNYSYPFYSGVKPKLSAHRLGLDLFQRFSVGRTDFRLGIGPAAAMIDKTDANAYYPGNERDYEGFGVGGFIDFRTRVGQIGRTDFALVGGIGQDYLTAGKDGGIYIRQLQLGIEARREFDHGSLILRTAYENQYWSQLYDVQGASFRLGYTW